MTAEYRADQVGSLLRPPRLLEARDARDAGTLDAAALQLVEDETILEALAMQRDTGIDVLVDGEFRRAAWPTVMAASVDGFLPRRRTIEWHGDDDESSAEASSNQVVGGRLHQHDRLTGVDAAYLCDHAGGPFKVTIPSPSTFMLVSFEPGVTDEFYESPEALVEELGAIVRAEVEALIADGVPYVQIDAPEYLYFLDDRMRTRLRDAGIDPDTALRAAVAADNACVAGLGGGDVVIGMHICRGNRQSMWLAQGGYEPIAERLFADTPYDRLLLEYDTDRAGGFEPLAVVPDDVTVVLGLLTSKRPELESVDDVARRIDDATKYHPIESLALSPQCGFASNSRLGNRVTPEEQQAKLARVVEVARTVWK